jgi:hypothetical protein
MAFGTIADNHDHQVKIPTAIFTFAGSSSDSNFRLWCDVKDWAMEQCDWHEDRFSMRLGSNYIDIWFEDERDQVMCILRWL